MGIKIRNNAGCRWLLKISPIINSTQIIGIWIIIFSALALSSLALVVSSVYAQTHNRPSLVDDRLQVEEVAKGINLATGMAFLGPNDILVLEQHNGTVLRVKNGTILPNPLLDVDVANAPEMGLLGIEILAREPGLSPFVFLYYTETQSTDGGNVLGNRLYRFTFMDDSEGGKLVDGKLLLDLPAVANTPTTRTIGGLEHNGGKLEIDDNGSIFLSIGDLRQKTKSQNFISGFDADGSGGILRISPEGNAVEDGILGRSHPLDKYFAYGIRNSFGIGFDPVTGYLWDTENGPAYDDEINLVMPGFNSGWQSVMGFIETPPEFEPEQLLRMVSSHIFEALHGVIVGNTTHAETHLAVAREQLESYPIYSGLYNFSERNTYSDPEFVWHDAVGPTAIQFFNSSKLGNKYLNEMFVGDSNIGRIYNFALNENRTNLDLKGNLSDKVANNRNETDSVLFGEGFGIVTDIKVGPDGFLYIMALDTGTIYRVTPKD